MQVHAFAPFTFNPSHKCPPVESWDKDVIGGMGRDGQPPWGGHGRPGAPTQDIQLKGHWIPLGRSRSQPEVMRRNMGPQHIASHF